MNITTQLNGGGWLFYQHCYIRKNYETPIAERLNFSQIEKEYCNERGLKKTDQKVYFAQYITDFDVEEPTEWWFTIKDNEYDLNNLKSKRRYEITKAHKFCVANEINPLEYLEELFDCYEKSFMAYPERYRPKNISFYDFEIYIKNLYQSEKNEFYITRFIETSKVIGFLILSHDDKFIGLTQLKTDPDFEKYNSNASLIDYVLTKYNEKLNSGDCIFTNGSRSIKHETNFNAYLEKYFGFRKAYAKLRITYRFPFGIIIKIIKPFKIFFEQSQNPLLYNIYCVLKMDNYSTK